MVSTYTYYGMGNPFIIRMEQDMDAVCPDDIFTHTEPCHRFIGSRSQGELVKSVYLQEKDSPGITIQGCINLTISPPPREREGNYQPM